MNVPKKWLTLVVTTLLCYSFGFSGVSTAGGDKKQDTSRVLNPGSIEAILRLRDKLPNSLRPTVSDVRYEGGEIVMTRQLIEILTERMLSKAQVTEFVTEQYTVKIGDRLEVRTRAVPVTRWVEREVTVNRPVVRSVKLKVAANSIKAFTVTKEGKLESLDRAKFLGMLTKPITVLIGDADVDPRHLELIRPSAIYLVIDEPSRPKEAPAKVQPGLK